MDTIPQKQCNACKTSYPLNSEHWHVDSTKRDGFRTQCKNCVRSKLRQYQKNNQDKARVRLNEWQRKNRDKTHEYYKKWRDKYPDRKALHSREYRKKYPDKVKVYGALYRKMYPEKMRHRGGLRRARLKNAQGSHTLDQVKTLYNHQGGRCFHCGRDLSNGYEKDHWIPLSRGGSDWISNIRLLCMPCNRSKGNKMPHEWDSRYLDSTA